MRYEIRSSIATSVVALIQVADGMATSEATLLIDAKSGKSHFHSATYDGRFNDHIETLLNEALAGKLRVCDQHSRRIDRGAGIAAAASD